MGRSTWVNCRRAASRRSPPSCGASSSASDGASASGTSFGDRRGGGGSKMNQIVRTSFVLSVPDVERAARYWCDALGFRLEATHGGWRFVARDMCRGMLGENPHAIPSRDL